MARLYTGQHGEFYFFVQDRLFGDIEGFDISTTPGAAGVEHRIINPGRVVLNGGGSLTKETAINQRRQSWEAVGWVRANADDYPREGDIFTANGKRATLSSRYRWSGKRPVARPLNPWSIPPRWNGA